MISVEHLYKNFGKLPVLQDVNLTIDKGDVVCIIGPSGSGKSTFLRCLNLLEKPQKGKIIFEGEDLMNPKIDLNRHRQKMGMVFQQFNLFPAYDGAGESDLRPCDAEKVHKGAGEGKGADAS